MKSVNRLSAIILTGLFLFTAASTMAQRGQGFRNQNFSGRGMGLQEGPRFNRQYQMIPDLTEEQKEQIKDLRVDHIKEMTQVRNKLMEKRASLRTLQTQDNPDMAAINKTIEEMGEVRTSLQKARAEHHQAIREILTEEQRTFFDARLKRGHRMAGCYGKRPMRGRPFRQGL